MLRAGKFGVRYLTGARDSPSVRHLISATKPFVGFLWNLVSELFAKNCAASLSFLNTDFTEGRQRIYTEWSSLHVRLGWNSGSRSARNAVQVLRFVKMFVGKAVRLWWASVQLRAHVHTCTVARATFWQSVCAPHRRRRCLQLSSVPECPDGL